MGSIIGPFGRPLDEERYVYLGHHYGSWDYDYHLFESGEVWCHETPNKMYGRASWWRVEGADLDRKMDDGKTVRQAVAENRKGLAGEASP